MCMDVSEKVKPTLKTVTVYKAFQRDWNTEELRTSYHPLVGEKRNVIRGKWLTSKKGPGFHFFFTESDAQNWGRIHNGYSGVVLPVKVRKITGTGYLPGIGQALKAGVAREIIIPREKK